MNLKKLNQQISSKTINSPQMLGCDDRNVVLGRIWIAHLENVAVSFESAEVLDTVLQLRFLDDFALICVLINGTRHLSICIPQSTQSLE